MIQKYYEEHTVLFKRDQQDHFINILYFAIGQIFDNLCLKQSNTTCHFNDDEQI